VSILNIGVHPALSYIVGEDMYDLPSNNTFATASDIGHGYYAELCQQDDDWYRFNVYTNQYVDVWIHFDGAANDMNMQLYGYNQSYITYSDTAMNYEVISFQSTYNGYYYIKISGNNNYEAYNMSIYVYDYIVGDDGYEENDVWFNPYSGIATSSWHYNLYLYDQDCSAFDVTPNSQVDIHLTHGYNAEFWIYALSGVNGFYLDVGASWYNYDLYTTWFSFNTGTFLGIIIISIQNMTYSGVSYDFYIEITPADDPYEDNDYWNNAYYGLMFNSWYNNLILNDVDTFGFYAYPYDKFEVFLEHAAGEQIWIDAYNQYGSYLNSSYNQDSYTTRLSLDVGNYQGNVIFVVTVNTYNGQFYNLMVQLNPASVGGEVWDIYEENDFREQAYQVTPGYYSSINITDTDMDWFKIFLNWGEFLEVRAFVDTNMYGLSMMLYSEGGYLIDISEDYSNFIECRLDVAPMSGFYYIHLYTWESVNVQYDLDIFKNTAPSKPFGDVNWVGVKNGDRYEWQLNYKSTGGMLFTQTVNQNREGTFSISISDITTSEGVARIKLNYENADILNGFVDPPEYVNIDNKGQAWNKVLPDPFGTSLFVGKFFNFADRPEFAQNPFGEIIEGGKKFEYHVDTSGIKMDY
jgi:hypothetical protein